MNLCVLRVVWGRHLRGAYAGLDPNVVQRLPVPQDALFRLVGGEIEHLGASVRP